MAKPLTAVTRTDDVACGARDMSQRTRRARRVLANPLFDQTPRGFDGIEIVRVRRQKANRGAPRLDQVANCRRFVCIEIVQQDDVAASQPWCQTRANPLFEAVVGDTPPAHPEREPPIGAHRAEQCQVVAPVHRPWFHKFFTPLHPGVRAAHRDIYARFIDGDQPVRIDGRPPRAKRFTLSMNVGSVALTRTPPFFLRTYPSRFIARRKLVGFDRPSRPTRRLYSRHNSSDVPSGRSRTTACSTMISIGDSQPPPRGRGSIDSVARYCATQRCRVRYPMPKRSARSWYPPSPASYAATARPRNATSYGFAMASVKYSSNVNSSA